MAGPSRPAPAWHPGRVSRTYRSGEPGTGGGGPFGTGTTLGWDDYVVATSATVQTYIYAGNAMTTFLKQPDGTYTNSTVPAFRGARLREPSGRALTLAYFQTGFFPIGYVADPLGRQTVYGYDGSKALLLSVTDPAG